MSKMPFQKKQFTISIQMDCIFHRDNRPAAFNRRTDVGRPYSRSVENELETYFVKSFDSLV